MSEVTGDPYPIQDPEQLKEIAKQIWQRMGGTDDGPAMGARVIADYPSLYAAALGITVARLRSHAGDEDQGEWLAKFLLVLAQDRFRSVFDRSGEPHWPEWMEDES